ncbi:hypothetical protein [Actinophytocola xinjiangensis]|uniref:hypothetical protein n=1 Tax=Actinophytocola xinjiangensis TaxID=485602 RepID=UPI000B2B9FD4|nr:hypothetical protein [Actinophytocola xinjiangensis]
MPKLNRDLIRAWLEDNNWTVARLTRECNTLTEDTIAEGTMRNVTNGIDPMRPGRIKVICRVLAKYGNGLPYEQLIQRPTEARPATRHCEPATPADSEAIQHPRKS